MGPAQDTVNIFDVSLGASNCTYHNTSSFSIAQDPSMMFLNQAHFSLYPGTLVAGGWSGHPPCSTVEDWSGVEIGFDISYDISPILGIGHDQISPAGLYHSKWSLDISYNSHILENATNSYTYEDGSNQRFFWGEGIKKWDYSPVMTSGAGSDVHDVSHINFRYLDLDANWNGTGDVPPVGFGQMNQVRIRIIDEIDNQCFLSDWCGSFKFPDWYIGGTEENVNIKGSTIISQLMSSPDGPLLPSMPKNNSADPLPSPPGPFTSPDALFIDAWAGAPLDDLVPPGWLS